MEQLYELNLRDYWGIFLKRKWEILISFSAVFLSIFLYTSLQSPIYRANVLIRVESSMILPSEVVFPVRFSLSRRFELSDYSKQLVSRPVIEGALIELNLLRPNMPDKERERLISDVSTRISAIEIERSNMIRLQAQFNDPQKAADVANKISQVFKRMNAEQRNEQNKNVRVFVENTLDDVSKELKEQDDRLRQLTTQGAIGSAVNIMKQISELENKIADLSLKYTDKHPNVISLKEQVENLKQDLQVLPGEEFEYGILKRNILINEKLYTSLKEQLQAAQIKEAESADNIVIISPAFTPRYPFYPNKPRNYIFGMLLGLLLGVSVALVTEHMDTSIGRVDDIESFIKVSVLGIIPYCEEQHREGERADKRRPRPRHPLFKKEVRRAPILATQMLELDKTHMSSLFLEAFRLLGVSLQVIFGQSGRIKNKLIMVTSCKPEEGKTVITSALGVIMSQMGYKVLILDSDVRRANIHKSFGLKSKENGLIDILTGKVTPDAAVKTATDIMLGNVSIDKVVEKPWLNNINIVTAGATFPNTITLFNSEKLGEALQHFRDKYDIVLVDTSPVLAVSEPSILLPKMDGVLLVYRVGYTSRLALRRAKTQIESIKGKGSLSGVILNNVTPEIGIDNYYYYNKKYYSEETKSKA